MKEKKIKRSFYWDDLSEKQKSKYEQGLKDIGANERNYDDYICFVFDDGTYEWHPYEW